jgi:hypothetical protein
MNDKKASASLTDDTGISYEIKVRGHVDGHWSDWLGGLEITQDEQGNSHLTGVIPDQAALHGVLNQIRNLGLTLISIAPQKKEEEMDENTKQNSR